MVTLTSFHVDGNLVREENGVIRRTDWHDDGSAWNVKVWVPRHLVASYVRREMARSKAWHDEHNGGQYNYGISAASEYRDYAIMSLAGLSGAYYTGPGRGFAHEPWIKKNRKYYIIDQFGGLDI